MKPLILVTGGLGYIGSHTVIELARTGYEPLIIDNLSNSSTNVLEGMEAIAGQAFKFEKTDLNDQSEMRNLFERNRNIQGVIHFAASKSVGESLNQPLAYYRNNVSALVGLLELIQANNINGIIFSSSCTVYGQPDVLPVTESMPVGKASSPYGQTKQIGEQILRDASSRATFRSIALRYFNPIGAHESGLIGELPNGVPSNLVPFMTQTAAGLRDKLRVFGHDYNTPDGTAIRDYIHVMDLASAHVAALHRQLRGKQASPYEFFNIGTGHGFSVLQLIEAFERVNNISLPYEIVDRRPGDIEKIFADTTRASEVLQWHARWSLDDMMRTAWLWQKSLMERKTLNTQPLYETL
jgi:UDP-glucose 4-epimerase